MLAKGSNTLLPEKALDECMGVLESTAVKGSEGAFPLMGQGTDIGLGGRASHVPKAVHESIVKLAAGGIIPSTS